MFNDNPFNLPSNIKKEWLLENLIALTEHHKQNCLPYSNILVSRNYSAADCLEDLPFLPVRLFKSTELKSSNNIIKTLTSSGTTGQTPSKIFVDSETATLQTKALVNVVTSFIGHNRLPMIIIDAELTRNNMINASAAGVLGFAKFGRDHLYLLDENGKIKWSALEDFANKYKDKEILIFGFTYRVWQWVLECDKFNFKGFLIHGGGWKKLTDQKVDNETFKKTIRDKLGDLIVSDYYGMVEQIGNVCFECCDGYLHTPNFSDIIIRNPLTLIPVENGESGILQSLSLLPKSYPGHSLLTEDLATKYGEDNCKCGRLGSFFKIHGRLPKSEIRGCSNTK